MQIYIYINIYTYIYTYIYIYHIYIEIYTYIYTYIYIDTYIYIYIHTYITYIYTYIHIILHISYIYIYRYSLLQVRIFRFQWIPPSKVWGVEFNSFRSPTSAAWTGVLTPFTKSCGTLTLPHATKLWKGNLGQHICCKLRP